MLKINGEALFFFIFIQFNQIPDMNILDTAAVLLTLTAVFGYINHRFFKLPTSIGILLIGLVLSRLLLLFGGDAMKESADKFVTRIDFNETVMNVMLSFLLFAGALHVNLGDLRDQKWVVAILASAGLLVSTFLIGVVSYFVFSWVGLDVPFLWCFVFGALISPTDPVAVLGILKKVFDRGVAAWRTGHRPGTTATQWGLARVNSFVTKSKGTWGKADSDLAAKVGKESVDEEKELEKILTTDGRMKSFKEKLRKLGYKKIDEGKSSSGYELYHNDFSSAMKHAYKHAKDKLKVDIDPNEIDDKVATGPRKHSKGKTNS